MSKPTKKSPFETKKKAVRHKKRKSEPNSEPSKPKKQRLSHEPLSVSSDDETDDLQQYDSTKFMIIEIQDRRPRGTSFQYLVKWAGLGDPRWETRESLGQWPSLLDKYDECFSPIERWTNCYNHGLPTGIEPTLQQLRRQFLDDGLTQMHQGIHKDDIFDLRLSIIQKFNTIIHTIRATGRQQQLEEQGFVEFKTRNYGRYDMQIHLDEFPALQEGFPWMNLVYSILGKTAQLTYSGCIIGIPGAYTQNWHSDGKHLSSKEYLPPHCLNVFVPLVDLTTENGPTQFQPCSHKDFDETQKKNDSPLVSILIPAGECILFDYRLMHRGLANKSKETRPVLYFTYATPAFKLEGDENFSRRRYPPLPDLIPLPQPRKERAEKRNSLKFGSRDTPEKKEKKKEKKKRE